MFDKIDQLGVNTIRMLSVDQINAANSGHPGLPLGAAPMAYALWTRHMLQDPTDSRWVNRDRFVLSAGHGSSMLYSLLHLAGFDLSIDDLKQFRQLGSKTPGHPEVGHTDGVEATTGPLGQGVATAVGMAMAEAHLAQTYNREGFDIIDHYTYALCGDGDLMEGVSAEACSLAGHLKLGKLILLYDSNGICLDGTTDTAFTESVGARYRAYGWQVLQVEDGNDLDAVSAAIDEAKADTARPTLIEIRTIIGFGAPKQGTNKVHGAPIGADTAALKANLDWHYGDFEVPQAVRERFVQRVLETGRAAHAEWDARFDAYRSAYPQQAQAFEAAFSGEYPGDWTAALPSYTTESKAMASRKYSEAAIQAIASRIDRFWGGSADLSSSNNTYIKDGGDFTADDRTGRNIWYGVREFAMGACMNGILLHGGTRTFVATFFVFSDYLKGAVRLAALSKLPAIYVMTHDSVAVGEDGPTHEPIEQLAAWRSMPNLDVIRPADGNETSQAWRVALESRTRPTMLVLSRQNLPTLAGTVTGAADGVERGAYVIAEAQGDCEGILIASGSEVGVALAAQRRLAEEGIGVRVVSMPSMLRFDEQPAQYRESVLPAACRSRISIEAGSTFGWAKYVGLDGVSIGLDRFGESGEGGAVMSRLGFSAEHVAETFKKNFR